MDNRMTITDEMATNLDRLPTEDTSTEDPEEAKFWLKAYCELSKQTDEMVREVATPSQTVIRAANRFQRRLRFWSSRYQQLTG
jgi:hypothetical protein